MTSSLVSIVGLNILFLHTFFDIDNHRSKVTNKVTLSDPNIVLNLFYKLNPLLVCLEALN